VTKPDPSLLKGVVAAEVLEAMEVASSALKAAGVRHVVVGGLAVGANGFPRATKGVPPGSFVEGPPLIYMKLNSPRLKDRADVIELIKAGLDVDACRSYLSANAPALVTELEAAVARARAEE
jgi:hypothetical protein